MNQIATTIIFYVRASIYPSISGPLAAYLFFSVLKRDDIKIMLAFWTSLLITHIAGFLFITGISGDLFTPGFVTCLVTPVFAVSTALGLRIASRRLSENHWGDTSRRTWLGIGTFLIPGMQVITVVIAALFAPSL